MSRYYKGQKNQFYTRHAHAHTHAHTVQKKATTHQLYSNEQEKHKTTRGTGICRKFPQGRKCWQMPFFLLLPNTDSKMVLEDNSDTLHPSTLVAPHAHPGIPLQTLPTQPIRLGRHPSKVTPDLGSRGDNLTYQSVHTYCSWASQLAVQRASPALSYPCSCCTS